LSLEDAIDEVALIKASVGPLISPTSILLALEVLTLKFDFALLPRLLAKAVLLIVEPFPFVGRSF
jgi:hypothetical protein